MSQRTSATRTPFGHAACSINDGPDARKDAGLHELGDQATQPGAAAVEATDHNWVWQGSSWHCSECWRQCRNRATVKAACKGMPPSLSTAVTGARDRGHTLAAAKTTKGTWFIWCEHCGAWGKNKAIRLTNRCLGPTPNGQRVLNRISRKQHPLGAGAGLIDVYVKVTVA